MATVRAAYTQIAGQSFVVAWVDRSVLNSSLSSEGALATLQVLFPGAPTALMALDMNGMPIYRSCDQNLLAFLTRCSPARLPWKDYNLN